MQGFSENPPGTLWGSLARALLPSGRGAGVGKKMEKIRADGKLTIRKSLYRVPSGKFFGRYVFWIFWMVSFCMFLEGMFLYVFWRYVFVWFLTGMFSHVFACFLDGVFLYVFWKVCFCMFFEGMFLYVFWRYVFVWFLTGMFSHVFACFFGWCVFVCVLECMFFGSYVFVCFEMYVLCFLCFSGKYAFYFDSYEVCFSNYQNRWRPW